MRNQAGRLLLLRNFYFYLFCIFLFFLGWGNKLLLRILFLVNSPTDTFKLFLTLWHRNRVLILQNNHIDVLNGYHEEAGNTKYTTIIELWVESLILTSTDLNNWVANLAITKKTLGVPPLHSTSCSIPSCPS